MLCSSHVAVIKEVGMKKSYANPELVLSGELCNSTKAPVASIKTLDGQPFQKNPSFGDVGFGL
jgi:hypothetical protein